MSDHRSGNCTLPFGNRQTENYETRKFFPLPLPSIFAYRKRTDASWARTSGVTHPISYILGPQFRLFQITTAPKSRGTYCRIVGCDFSLVGDTPLKSSKQGPWRPAELDYRNFFLPFSLTGPHRPPVTLVDRARLINLPGLKQTRTIAGGPSLQSCYCSICHHQIVGSFFNQGDSAILLSQPKTHVAGTASFLCDSVDSIILVFTYLFYSGGKTCRISQPRFKIPIC